MTEVVGALVPLVVVPAVVLSALVLAVGGVSAALPVLLDLLLVAGLLRLSATASWSAIASAALVVVIRKVASAGLRAGPSGGAGLPAEVRRALRVADPIRHTRIMSGSRGRDGGLTA